MSDIIPKDPFQLPDEEVKGVGESVDRFLNRVDQICTEFKASSERKYPASDEMQWILHSWINVKCNNCGFMPLDITNIYFENKVNKFCKHCRKCGQMSADERDTI